MGIIFNTASAVIFLLIVIAAIRHSAVSFHVRLMKICFFLDVVLLLMVEVFRGAVERLLGFAPLGPDINLHVLYVHIPFAVLTLVFWVLQIVSGTKVLKGNRALLPRHALCAKIFLLIRLGNLVTALLLY